MHDATIVRRQAGEAGKAQVIGQVGIRGEGRAAVYRTAEQDLVAAQRVVIPGHVDIVFRSGGNGGAEAQAGIVGQIDDGVEAYVCLRGGAQQQATRRDREQGAA